MTHHRLNPFITTLGLLVAILGITESGRAAVFNVSSVAELRTAFTTAASNGEADTVNIAAGTYQPASQIDFNGNEDYEIVILGAGAGQTILDGSLITSFGRVLRIYQYGTPASHITVSGLTVQNSGGLGMDLNNNTLITITDCEIKDNAAGGLYTFSPEGDITVERCVFSGNVLNNGDGAGLYGHTMRSYFLRNSVFVNNQATGTPSWGGGGFYGGFDPVTAEHIEVVNNTFVGNTSGAKGGGFLIGMWGSWGTVNIHNNIIRDNLAGEGGNDGDDLWIDPADCSFGFFNNDLGDNADTFTGHSEDLEISNTANYTHAGNLAVDPQLGAGFHLGPGSPCIDAGNDSAPNLPTIDFEGDLRIVGEHVDMGADELAPVVTFVTSVSELQAALTAAETNGRNDEIQVAPGLYQPLIPLVYVAHSEEHFSLTITGAGDGVTVFDGGGTTRIFELATVNTSGGDDADLRVEDILFLNGFTDDPTGGAALYVYGADSAVEVTRCSFVGNLSSAGGAGAAWVLTDLGAVRFESVRFLNNMAVGVSAEGGGLKAQTSGGPIWLVNCVFYDNSAGGDGGGASLNAANEMVGIINTTVVENVAAVDDPLGIGGGVLVALYGDTAIGVLENSIFWSNGSNGTGNDLVVLSDVDNNGVGATVEFANSVIGPDADPMTGTGLDLLVTPIDNYSSWGCLQTDPVLGPDFHLDPISPCIDAGDDFAPELPVTDFEGQARVAGAAVDIGADEYHVPPFFSDDFESGSTGAWTQTVP